MAGSDVVAKVLYVHGHAYVRAADGKHIELKAGVALHEGEVIVTARGAAVQLESSAGRTCTIWQNETVSVELTLFTPEEHEHAWGQQHADVLVEDDDSGSQATRINSFETDDIHDFVLLPSLSEPSAPSNQLLNVNNPVGTPTWKSIVPDIRVGGGSDSGLPPGQNTGSSGSSGSSSNSGSENGLNNDNGSSTNGGGNSGDGWSGFPILDIPPGAPIGHTGPGLPGGDRGGSGGSGGASGSGSTKIDISIGNIPTINGTTGGSSAPVMITGQVSTNVAPGSVVTITVDGHQYTGTVQPGWTYSIGVPGNVLAAASTDVVTATVSMSLPNSPNITASATHTYDVDLSGTAISIAIDPIAPITIAEAGSSNPVLFTGTVSANVPVGDTVTLTTDGHTYTGTVQAGGTYSIGVPGNVLAGAASGSVHVSVSVSDSAGNVSTASAGEAYSLQAASTEIGIAINPIGIVNGAEAASAAPIFITGTVTANKPAGSIVTLNVDGHTYTGIVQSDGTYSIGVPGNVMGAAATDVVHLSVTVTSVNGDGASATANETYIVELTAPPISVVVDPVTPLSAADATSANPIAVTGTVSANVPIGDTVTLTVAGHTYTGTVQAGDTFSVGVPGNVMAGASSLHVSLSATDAAGNVAHADVDVSYSVVPTPPIITVTVDPIAPITSAEAGSSAPVEITGTVSTNAPVASVVTVTVDGHTYTGTVQSGGTYSVGVPGNILAVAPNDTLQVSGSTGSGGSAATASSQLSYTVAADTGTVVVTVDPIPTINGADAASSNPIAVTGQVSTNVPSGSTVTVSVGTHSYVGVVTTSGAYSVGVPGNVLASAAGDDIQVSVTTTGAGGTTTSSTLPYTVELTAPPISVTATPLGAINSAEAASSAPVVISGTVSANVPAGTVVTATIDGQNYTGAVQGNGTYSVGIPGNVLGASTDDTIQVNVSTTDAAGNTATSSATLTYTVASTPALIDIAAAPIPVINGAEAASSAPIAITGAVSANVPVAGDTVTVTVGGNVYSGTVQADGSYSIGVPGSVLGHASSYVAQIGVAASDGSGGVSSASITQSYAVELTAPPIGIAVNPIATINAAEAGSASLVAISGTVSANVPVGTVVTMTSGTDTYTGTVQAGDTWSIGVPGNVLANATTDSVHVSISSTDAAGNVATATSTQLYSVEATAPAIGVAIDPIATINGAEAASATLIAITGTVSANVAAGTTVTLTAGGTTYTGTVQAGGTYSIGVPGNVLAGTAADSINVSVSTVDAAGNTSTASNSETYNVELTAPAIGIGINPIAPINAAEAASSAPIPITGTVSANVPTGDTVTLSVGGQTYAGTVQAGGTYSIGIPGNVLANASTDSVHASVSATDAAGNTASASADQSYSTNTTGLAISIAINPLATINSSVAGSASPVAVTGTVSANVPVGDTVTLTVGGQTYTGTVQAGGTYSIGVPGTVLGAATSDSIQASVSVTDGSGNVSNASTSQAYTVELNAAPVSISITPMTTINGAEAASSTPILVSGTVSANVPVGDSVTVSVAGQSYTGTVQSGGTYSIGVPGNMLGGAGSDNLQASISVTDAAGNVANASANQAYSVELTAPAISATVNPLPVINGSMAASSAPVAITGTVSANVPAGELVTVTVHGNAFTGTVQANGTFSVGVPGNILGAAGNDSVHVGLSFPDAAGNVSSVSVTQVYTVELTAAPIAIDLDPIATINGAQAASSALIMVSGSVSSAVPAGDVVTLVSGGQSYTGTVQSGGTFSIGVPGNVLASAGNGGGSVVASVSATDAAGNVASASTSEGFAVELSGPAISIGINAVATVNGAEAASASPVAINGTVSSNVPVGDSVTLTVGGNNYSGTVQAGDTWSIGVPGNVLGTASSVQASVSATDSAGNVSSAGATQAYTVELTAPAIGIGINSIATVNAAEAASSAPVPITGTVTSNVPVGDTVTLTVNGQSYTGAVQTGGTYSIGIPGNVLANASTDSVHASVSATDAAGNVATAGADQSYSVNTTGLAVSIGLNPVVVINAAIGNSANPVAVTGTVNANVPVGDVVTLTVAGQTYTGTVLAGGIFSVGVPGNVLANAQTDSIEASVSVTDQFGNVTVAVATEAYNVELVAPAISINVNTIVTVNAAAAASSSLIAVTGSVSANVPAGDIVNISVGGHNYSGTVQAGGGYSIGVPGNVLAAAGSDNIQASISTTDAAGNVASASASVSYSVELAAPPISISVNPIAVINAIAAASSAALAVSGTVSANVPAGDVVSLQVGGQTYTGVVQAGGTYSIGVPGNVLAAASSDNLQVSVSTTDAAGNVASASASQAYTVELAAAPISIAVDPIATINGAEAASATPIAITGTVSASVPVGDTVTLTVAGHSYHGTVQLGGTYSIGVPGSILAGATSDNVHVSVSATDSAGNVASATATQSYTVELSAPSIAVTIDPIAVITSILVGSGNPFAITGTVSANVPVGTPISVSVAGQVYTGTVQAGDTYSVAVPILVLLGATLDLVQVTVSYTDAAGNVATASSSQGYTINLLLAETPQPVNSGSSMHHQIYMKDPHQVLPATHEAAQQSHAEANSLRELTGIEKFGFSLAAHPDRPASAMLIVAGRGGVLHMHDLVQHHAPAFDYHGHGSRVSSLQHHDAPPIAYADCADCAVHAQNVSFHLHETLYMVADHTVMNLVTTALSETAIMHAMLHRGMAMG